MRSLLLSLGLVVLLAAASSAQTPRVPQETAVQPGALGQPAAENGRVEVPPPSDKALRYYHTGNVLWLVDVGWDLLVPCLFLFTGFSARLGEWAHRLGRHWFFTVCIYGALFIVCMLLLQLPLAFYQGFVRPHAYGLSNQSLTKWSVDWLKAVLVYVAVGVAILWIPYLLLARSPRRWWLYTGILTVPLLFLGALLLPIWIEPLFNDFGNMKDRALEAKILALAERAGIEGSRVYEVNKSVDTKAVNAYVTGFLHSKRIVLWDTLLAKLDEEEVLFVMGHEMGHYVLGHVVQGILLAAAGIFLALYFLHRTAPALLRRFQGRFGFSQMADVASLPLLLLLLTIFSLVVNPVGLACSRYIEHEADRFGLEITHDNYAAATAFVKLERENLANPRPGLLYKFLRATHPPIGERIDFCNEYRPWSNGQPLVYGHLFRERTATE
jgi:Zn-dependent protease with chaperone function